MSAVARRNQHYGVNIPMAVIRAASHYDHVPLDANGDPNPGPDGKPWAVMIAPPAVKQSPQGGLPSVIPPRPKSRVLSRKILMNITPAPVMDLAARVVPNGVTVLGVDRFGMDYRNAGGRQRMALEPDSDTVYR